MIKFKVFIFSTLCFLISTKLFSQNLTFTFGSFPRSDLEMEVYQPDPTASAVVLSDIGYAHIEYSGDAFQIVLNRNVRIKIINRNGLGYANVEIPYYSNDRVTNVLASTYNLVNDSIVETKIDKKEMFTEKTTKYFRKLLIAFPNVSEGSVIEYQYRYTTKAFYRFIPWEFQQEIPVYYSDFTAELNDFFNYRAILKGDSKSIYKRTETKDVYFGGYATTGDKHRWVGNKIPAFIEEPLITGTPDHVTKLEFELVGVNFPGSGYKVITPTYLDLSRNLLEDTDFGNNLKSTQFLRKHTENVVKGLTTNLDKLKAIHRFVSNKILWNGNEDYNASIPLKTVFKEERGNSAEINMILIAMLRHAGIAADPVILSTRSNGSLHPTIAMSQQFNYLVAHVEIDGKTHLVDATDPLRPFNVLPFECLNNKGRLIHLTKSKWVDLANSESEGSIVTVNAEVDGNGDVRGSAENSYIGYDAYSLRKYLDLRGLFGYDNLLRVSYPSWELSDLKLENVDSLEVSPKETYSFVIKNGVQTFNDGMLINPFMLTNEQSNPFSAEERKFPIDFGCPQMMVSNINIKIPDGYSVTEIPSSISIKLPDDGGSFIISYEVIDNFVKVQSKFSIKTIRYKPEDYTKLREFYAQIFRKQSELIVLKKNQL